MTGWNGDGPLNGVRVIEMLGVGPVPFACMLMADLGAEILTVSAPGRGAPETFRNMYDPMMRGRAVLEVDLKAPGKSGAVLELMRSADILVEGFRPGVMERLALGPDACLAVNPVLVYGRMSGYGQDGPMAPAAGHDPNYLSIAGALGAIGPRDGPPSLPLNLVGDFAGGSLFLAFGVVAALLRARESGRGQVVDAAIVDGVSSLLTMTHALRGAGLWNDRRESNHIDGGSPFARAYRCADGGFVAVAAAEDKFYRTLVGGLGLDPSALPERGDVANWPRLAAIFSDVFARRTRDEWVRLFEGKDACLTPVLDLGEAASHPHALARDAFVARQGTAVPNVTPRFSETPGALAPDSPGGAAELLRRWGVDAAALRALEIEEGRT